MSSKIAYIVLPPGHGKSFWHLYVPGLLEADSVFPCRATQILSDLRTQAKKSGEWDQYDEEWSNQLKTRIEKGEERAVVMVPSWKVGEKAGWTDLGTLLLTKEVWAKNFDLRKDTHEKHEECWQEGYERGAQVYESLWELGEEIKKRADQWLRRKD
jgi:hypothetical protein